MKNTYFQANLISPNRINVLLFTSIVLSQNPVFFLEKDSNNPIKLKIVRHISNGATSIFELEMPENYDYGHSYDLVLEGFYRIPLEVSQATEFPGFDEKFFYDGDDLGAIYIFEETKFNLWAPLASRVLLKIEEHGEFHTHEMKRSEKGVYRISLKGNHLNARYSYLVTNSGVTQETIDPWGKGASFNTEYSAVVDIDEIKKMHKHQPQNVIERKSAAIIYEASIRDFTENKHSNIVHKGKYLGMVEPNRKTEAGNPAGLDYLKYLGITHLQILPVIDFFGNDDKDITKSYNWGYNPISFFALEGSYATKPEIPMNRLVEFKTMVEDLHKNNIRVNMDVVYNHLYEFMYTCFEKTVPNYFYRRRPNGLPACASGCGDDFASEKLMARKAIIDSLKYFTDVFNIDGFRFDLMGLIDIETINKGLEECKKIKKDIIFYGEGWNMGAELPLAKKACSDNADKMPEVAFFNDLYRDTMRGGNFRDNITTKGYIGGNLERQDIVNYAIKGSTIDIPFKHRFLSAEQSLNYIECHDNNTLFDKLTFSNEGEDAETLLARVKFANKLLLLSFGMVLIHMGQEVGLSKSGLDNTYNVLKINNMSWKAVDERFAMVVAFAKHIELRKTIAEFFKKHDLSKVISSYDVSYWNNGMLAYTCEKTEILQPFKKMAVLINPTLEQKTYELDDYYHLLLNLKKIDEGYQMKNGIIPPLTIQVLFK